MILAEKKTPQYKIQFLPVFFWVTLYRLSWAEFLILLSHFHNENPWHPKTCTWRLLRKAVSMLHLSSGQTVLLCDTIMDTHRQENSSIQAKKECKISEEIKINLTVINFTWLNKHYQALSLSDWGPWGLTSLDWGLQHWSMFCFPMGNVNYFHWKDGLVVYVRIFSVSPDIQAEVTNFLACWSQQKKMRLSRQHACISEFACRVEDRMPHGAKTKLFCVLQQNKVRKEVNTSAVVLWQSSTAENPANLRDDQTNWFRPGRRW